MYAILTTSSEKSIRKDESVNFLQDLKLSIKAWSESEKCMAEVIQALIKEELVAMPLASDGNKTVSFEVEAFVGDTVVLSYVGLAL